MNLITLVFIFLSYELEREKENKASKEVCTYTFMKF